MSKTRPSAAPAKSKPAAKPAKRVPLTPAQLKVARIKESRRLSAYILAHKELNKRLVKPALTEAAKRIVHKTHDKKQIDTIWYNIAKTGAKLAVKQYGGIVENAVIRLTAQALKESYGGSLTKATTARMIVEQFNTNDNGTITNSPRNTQDVLKQKKAADNEARRTKVAPVQEQSDEFEDMDDDFDFGVEEPFEDFAGADEFEDDSADIVDLDGFEDAIEFDEEDFDDDEGYVPGRGRGIGDEGGGDSYGGDRWRDPGSLGSRSDRWR